MTPQEKADKAIQDWLSERENFSARAERMFDDLGSEGPKWIAAARDVVVKALTE